MFCLLHYMYIICTRQLHRLLLSGWMSLSHLEVKRGRKIGWGYDHLNLESKFAKAILGKGL